MINSILYKEWLKIRWAYLIMFGVFLLVLAKIGLQVAYDIRQMDANGYWYNVVIRQMVFYSWLLYIPVLSGIVTGSVQFTPEIGDKRLKLTLHLPMNESKILLTMTSIGFVLLAIQYLVVYLILSVIVLHFFPVQILSSVLITSLPWFLAGLIAYLATTMIFTEPVWVQRVLLIIVSWFFVNTYLIFSARGGYEIYSHSMPWFIVLSLFYIISILTPAQRFRRGVE